MSTCPLDGAVPLPCEVWGPRYVTQGLSGLGARTLQTLGGHRPAGVCTHLPWGIRCLPGVDLPTWAKSVPIRHLGPTAHLAGAPDMPTVECSAHRVHHHVPKVVIRVVANQQHDSCESQICAGSRVPGSRPVQDFTSDLESLSDHLFSGKSEPSKVFCVRCVWRMAEGKTLGCRWVRPSRR